MYKRSKKPALAVVISMLMILMAVNASANALSKPVFEWGFEEDEPTEYIYKDYTANCEVNKESAYILQGSQSLKVTASAADKVNMQRNSVCTGLDATGNTTYRISAYVKTEDGENTIKIYPGNAFTTSSNNRNTVKPQIIDDSYVDEVSSTEWTKISCDFTMTENDVSEASSSKDRGFNILVKADNAGVYYIENIVVEKIVKPAFVWNFEADETNTVNSGIAEVNTDSKYVYSGSQSLKVESTSMQRNGITGLVIDGKYMMSCYVKTAEGENNISIKPGDAFVNSSGDNKNSVRYGVRKSEEIAVNDKEWTKVSCYFTIVANEGGARDRGVNLLFTAENNGTYYIDNVVIEPVQALDLDDTYYAIADKNAVSNASELTIYTAEKDKTVYVMAASYNGNKLDKVKLYNKTISDKPVTFSVSDIDANYKIFIWDGDFKPLNSTVDILDF